MIKKRLTLAEIRANARANAKKQYQKRKDDPDFKKTRLKQNRDWYQRNKKAISEKRKKIRELKKQIRLL